MRCAGGQVRATGVPPRPPVARACAPARWSARLARTAPVFPPCCSRKGPGRESRRRPGHRHRQKTALGDPRGLQAELPDGPDELAAPAWWSEALRPPQPRRRPARPDRSPAAPPIASGLPGRARPASPRRRCRKAAPPAPGGPGNAVRRLEAAGRRKLGDNTFSTAICRKGPISAGDISSVLAAICCRGSNNTNSAPERPLICRKTRSVRGNAASVRVATTRRRFSSCLIPAPARARGTRWWRWSSRCPARRS